MKRGIICNESEKTREKTEAREKLIKRKDRRKLDRKEDNIVTEGERET